MFEKIKEEYKLSDNLNITINNKSKINNNITNETHMLVLPIKTKSERRQRIIKLMNKAVQKILLQNHVIQNVCKSEKLSSYFNIKYSTKLEHQHELSYLTQYP